MEGLLLVGAALPFVAELLRGPGQFGVEPLDRLGRLGELTALLAAGGLQALEEPRLGRRLLRGPAALTLPFEPLRLPGLLEGLPLAVEVALQGLGGLPAAGCVGARGGRNACWGWARASGRS